MRRVFLSYLARVVSVDKEDGIMPSCCACGEPVVDMGESLDYYELYTADGLSSGLCACEACGGSIALGEDDA